MERGQFAGQSTLRSDNADPEYGCVLQYPWQYPRGYRLQKSANILSRIIASSCVQAACFLFSITRRPPILPCLLQYFGLRLFVLLPGACHVYRSLNFNSSSALAFLKAVVSRLGHLAHLQPISSPSPMPPLNPFNGPLRKLVLAFDVGTTFSGVGYAILDPGEVPKIQAVTR